jgi:hypothetical protein
MVHTMTDYYDGPRKGIADFQGRPHLYESQWDHVVDDYASKFRLSPVEPAVFVLAMESWRIWRRWETAFHEGQTTHETHPALPEDRARSQELDRLLEPVLRIDETNVVWARGEFKVRKDADYSGKGFAPLQVRWTLP